MQSLVGRSTNTFTAGKVGEGNFLLVGSSGTMGRDQVAKTHIAVLPPSSPLPFQNNMWQNSKKKYKKHKNTNCEFF